MTAFEKIVILTGAGISAESGVKTFRAADGLWENHRIEDVATSEAFIKNPTLVHDPIFPMHGELLKIRCKQTQFLFDCLSDTSPVDHCNCCEVAGNLRPHVVWFGEMPLFMNEIETAIRNCDLFVAIGTSGNVYPAAGFVQTAKYYRAHTVELNLEPSVTGSLFDEQHYGLASQIVPEYFSNLL
jgi:NAD-dependent deacetylase